MTIYGDNKFGDKDGLRSSSRNHELCSFNCSATIDCYPVLGETGRVEEEKLGLTIDLTQSPAGLQMLLKAADTQLQTTLLHR